MMKNLLLVILLTAFCSLQVFAQCETEPTIEKAGKILKQLKIKISQAETVGNSVESEIGLFVKASVRGASWQKKGAEAAVLTVFVDGKYNQDAVLFVGAKVFEYQMLLGKYRAGEHKITIVLNEERSAPNARSVRIHTAFSAVFENLIARAKTTDRSIPAYIAMINAPIIYLRPNTIDKFSDIPLLTFYEIFDEPENIKKIRYTTIFTNEDGGTQSAALMARWGRMTDIEWIYEIRMRENGEILSEIYQGANHETKNFSGKRFGSHPLIFDATDNNNFADRGCSVLRVSPILVAVNLSDASRETVMDAFPWTYQIMAQEAFREGRVNSNKLDANTIADPRDYLYAEIYMEAENAAIALESETNGGEKFLSDAGVAALRVSRHGYMRIALHLPPKTNSEFPTSITVACYPISNQTGGACQNLRVVKLVRLDRNYLPVIKKFNSPPQNIKTGKKAVFRFQDEKRANLD